jgi:hypothetical protein
MEQQGRWDRQGRRDLKGYRDCRENLDCKVYKEQPGLHVGISMETVHVMQQQKISTLIRSVMRLIARARKDLSA